MSRQFYQVDSVFLTAKQCRFLGLPLSDDALGAMVVVNPPELRHATVQDIRRRLLEQLTMINYVTALHTNPRIIIHEPLRMTDGVRYMGNIRSLRLSLDFMRFVMVRRLIKVWYRYDSRTKRDLMKLFGLLQVTNDRTLRLPRSLYVYEVSPPMYSTTPLVQNIAFYQDYVDDFSTPKQVVYGEATFETSSHYAQDSAYDTAESLVDFILRTGFDFTQYRNHHVPMFLEGIVDRVGSS